MPRRRSLPDALGIILSLTGSGSKLRALRSSRSRCSITSPNTTERAVTPSTPADRAPRFPLTRSHATVRNAGSATRLNRSSNRRPSSSVDHWCSLVWIPSTRTRASSRLGHETPVFTSGLLAFHSIDCGPAGPLRHVDGFPALGLLRALRPLAGPSAHGEPARRPAGRWPGRTTRQGFPRSLCAGRQDRRPALPLQPRHHRTRSTAEMASPPTSIVGFGVAGHVRPGQRALLPGPDPPGSSRFHP